jgi:hypothetical protein
MQHGRYSYTLLLLFLVLTILSVENVFAGKKLVENWDSTPALDATWGNVGGNDHKTYIKSGELHQLIRPYCTAQDPELTCVMQARTRFLSSEYNTMTRFSGTLRLENTCDINTNSEFDFCAADFSGFFYNTNAAPSDATGDVFFVARIGERGSGLEAWWEIWEAQDGNYDESNLFDEGTFTPPLGGWQLGTDYILDVTYDGTKTFTGTFGGQTISGAVGPEKGDSAFWAEKRLRVRAWLLQPFTGDPDMSMVHAVFGDVSIDTGSGLTLHDDFNSGALSASDWDNNRLLREVTVTDKKLKLSYKTAPTDIISSSGVSLKARLPEEYSSTNYIQADILIEDGITADGTRSEAYVQGSFGNGKYSTDPGNTDGEISVSARVQKDNDPPYTYKLHCFTGMCDNSDCSSYIEYNWPDTFSHADPDTVYTASIRKNGTVLSCEIKETTTGVIKISSSLDLANHGIPTIYPVNEYKQFRVRIRNNPGEVVGYFDNVFVEGGSSILFSVIPVIASQAKK